MTKGDFLKALDELNVWRKRGEEAPHKPLMLLMALCRVIKRKRQMAKFEEVEAPLTNLLKQYGQERSHYHPEYPFWRLQTSGFWKLENDDLVTPRKSNTDPPRSQLILHDVQAGFCDSVYCMLAADDKLVVEAIDRVLDGYFEREQVATLLLGVLSAS